MTAGRRWRVAALVPATLVLALVVVGAAGAQVTPPRPPPARPDSTAKADTGQRADSLARQDTTAARRLSGRIPADTLPTRRTIVWDAADSVMAAMLEKKGYSVTRYQGAVVTIRAKQHLMELVGKPSQVSRDSATLVGDTITFNDSTEIVIARGDTLVLRDPTRGPDDITGLRQLRYNNITREGTVFGVTTAFESGERWIVHGDAAAFKDDSLTSAFYAKEGWITSCTEKTPHYHFASGEMKLISKNVLIARPAILYIADIPVMWLPFIFQDIRTGRRSGLVPPRFGFTEIVRNSPTYRRNIEDFGYYFAISDYMDAAVTMDWRSDARATLSDPGWVKLNGRMNYRIRDRFISGQLGASYHMLKNGERNQAYSLSHTQDFSQRTRLTADLNYVTNTTVQRNTQFSPLAAIQTISSRLAFNTARGPLTMNLGGSQTQYPGRDQLDRDFPSLTINSKTIRVGEWLSWTPALSITNRERFHITQVGQFPYNFFNRTDGSLDSSRVDAKNRSSAIRFDTPVEVFGFRLQNSFSLTDDFNDYPESRIIYDFADTSKKQVRIYKRTYLTSFDWQTGFALPGCVCGKLNVAPSIQIQKVDGGAGLFVRTERTGDKFVSQSLRPAFSLGISPTLFGTFGGLGPVAAIRHSITAGVGFAYVPAGHVSDEFLAAIGRRKADYLGANRQETLQLQVSTVFEAKLRPKVDTTPPEQWQKIKLLSLGFSPLSWDFERARVTKATGLTNRDFDINARSDLLPGFDLGVGWSLFQGDPISDTAQFKPYRTSIRGALALGPSSSLVKALGRLLGMRLGEGEGGAPGSKPPASPGFSTVGASPKFVAGQPIAGSINRFSSMSAPAGQAWQWSLSYSASRQRPPTGTGVTPIDPLAQCEAIKLIDPILYNSCVLGRSQQGGDTFGPGTQTTFGGTSYLSPPQSSAQSQLTFHVTEKWGAMWSTTYDFEQKQFASHIITLTREMHDWDAVFAFTRAPNGNLQFNLHLALKAEPDLKIDVPRNSYPRGYAGPKR